MRAWECPLCHENAQAWSYFWHESFNEIATTLAYTHNHPRARPLLGITNKKAALLAPSCFGCDRPYLCHWHQPHLRDLTRSSISCHARVLTTTKAQRAALCFTLRHVHDSNLCRCWRILVALLLLLIVASGIRRWPYYRAVVCNKSHEGRRRRGSAA